MHKAQNEREAGEKSQERDLRHPARLLVLDLACLEQDAPPAVHRRAHAQPVRMRRAARTHRASPYHRPLLLLLLSTELRRQRRRRRQVRHIKLGRRADTRLGPPEPHRAPDARHRRQPAPAFALEHVERLAPVGLLHVRGRRRAALRRLQLEPRLLHAVLRVVRRRRRRHRSSLLAGELDDHVDRVVRLLVRGAAAHPRRGRCAAHAPGVRGRVRGAHRRLRRRVEHQRRHRELGLGGRGRGRGRGGGRGRAGLGCEHGFRDVGEGRRGREGQEAWGERRELRVGRGVVANAVMSEEKDESAALAGDGDGGRGSRYGSGNVSKTGSSSWPSD
ncbi:hypothetical protein B0H10DRAFT_404466 [Mycena sp. CBHHK59/15]|nr:hypothetical protein B0H10DRAFT_404466 [Mycena sp. CBHHK59/15]